MRFHPLKHERTHGFRNPVGRPRRIDRLDAPGLFAREFQKTGANVFVKAFGFPIQPVLPRSVALSPTQAGGHGKIEEKGEIRGEAVGGPGIHGAQCFQFQPARVALIGQGGIDKPVTDHDCTLPECRRNDVVHMLTARRENHKDFRFCGQ